MLRKFNSLTVPLLGLKPWKVKNANEHLDDVKVKKGKGPYFLTVTCNSTNWTDKP